MTREEFIEIDEELQRLAFNLADALDTLNYHSLNETVDDLRKNIFPLTHSLTEYIRKLLKNMNSLGELFPDADASQAATELKRMDSLIDVVNKCTGEVKNYRSFVEALIPLIKACSGWGDQGPLSSAGVF